MIVFEKFTFKKIKGDSLGLLKQFKITAVKESSETKAAGKLLWKMVFKQYEPTREELIFLKGQSLDIARIFGLFLISGIPVPVPLTAIILGLQSKYKFNIIKPSSPEIPKSLIQNAFLESCINK